MKIRRVPYPKFGAGPGLERVAAVAAHLGVDLSAFGRSAAAVVGSNGKGSTAAMTSALLSQVSDTVGLFTSPHLLALNERFRIGEEDIADEAFDHHWRRVAAGVAACGVSDKMGGFEFLFLIAADWFRARRCEYSVWEAGLGGRLDPVRLIQAQRTALTALDLEHADLLGSTRAEIALEKIAAAPPRSSAAVGATVAADDEVMRALERWRLREDVALEVVAPLEAAPLAGEHQRSNAALALWLARSMAPLSDEQVRAGFAATRWPGRLEVLSDNPLEVIDVGHTPAAVAAALAGFETMRGDRSAVLVCGVSQDKDVAALVSQLAPAFSTIVCAAARHKGAPAALIAAHAQAANPAAEISLAESVAEARRLALGKAQGGATYVAGGLFLAAEYKAVHSGRDPASLVFF
jgi:dihydrofolate synthase/folylpolyglutamate synthase